ncbi:MAG: BamA/TamA family outer membrane protein [Rhodobacteraceae bacterium]|nr:BamA/TamA family outer membrane protein [Paracoccaceae bacterium]
MSVRLKGVIRGTIGALSGAALLVCPVPALSLERLVFSAPAASPELLKSLQASSLSVQAKADGETDPLSLFAAARADYGRLVGALYSEGYYSGVIHILVDGREAAEIAPLEAPTSIREIRIEVQPGPLFRFSAARMKPYAKGTELPSDYRDTLPAKSAAIVAAASAGVEGWRNTGHPKADVAGQDIVADHRSATVASEIVLEPGPLARFGTIRMTGQERMKERRLAKIAGFPTGEIYSPAELKKVAARLRDTGVFRSVAVSEADALGPGDTLDVDVVLVEEKLRRFGFGAELSSTEGLNLSGYWLHRNLFGGAERLRVDGAVTQIGSSGNAVGYSLGARIDRPATPVTDASAFLAFGMDKSELFATTLTSTEFSFGLTRGFGDYLHAEAGLSYASINADYPFGARSYERLALPVSLTWDKRDNVLDTAHGYYLQTVATPFLGFGRTGSGIRLSGDLRGYRGLGTDDRLVLAGRMQFGTVVGPALLDTPPDYLFASGGGGTVRGQPYQSLGSTITQGAVTTTTGGMSFAGLTGEARFAVTDTIGAVAFYDAGFISDAELMGGTGRWHSGAGIGARYNTGIGPIRLDIGVPVSGGSGGVQFYIGIGQAF